MSERNRPNLGPEIDEEIETAQYEITKAHWDRLKSLSNSPLAQIARIADPTAAPPENKRTIYLGQLLGAYACELFDVEASKYPSDPQRKHWLSNLATRIGTMIEETVKHLHLDFHATKAQRLEAITDALKEKIEAWVLPVIPLLREHEAFKKMKGLISGPHEEIYESLVRETIAMKLRIKPEEVTPKQINFELSELLPYYGAIRLIPSNAQPEPTKKRRKSRARQATPQIETVAAQLMRLKDESKITAQELADLIDVEVRSVQRHLAGDSVPYDRYIRAYQREFSKLLKRKVVINKLS